jgi:SAM-dependent methyltransferase
MSASPPPTPPPGALHAPHTERNTVPILDVLARVLGRRKAVLEIACGSGEQAPHFAAALAPEKWLSCDISAEAVASATAWARASGQGNLLTPMVLDVAHTPWGLPAGFAPDAIICINMIHIAPPAACQGLMTGASAVLAPGGVLYLYGPYKVAGAHTAPSNADFDRSLRARNPKWGIRDIEDVASLAEAHGLKLTETIDMPANNLSLVLEKT